MKKKKSKKDPFSVVGKFGVGIGKIYKKRSDLYVKENQIPRRKTAGQGT